jgi:hypothetical protein
MSAESPSTVVRPATAADCEAIAALHNQGIAERISTFDTEPRSADSVRTSLEAKGHRFPTIVVERDGKVIGWASAGAYPTRSPRQYTASGSCDRMSVSTDWRAGRFPWMSLKIAIRRWSVTLRTPDGVALPPERTGRAHFGEAHPGVLVVRRQVTKQLEADSETEIAA